MIIDAHGHYTTAPAAHWEFRRRLLEAQDDPARMPSLSSVSIVDDEIRESVDGAQLRLQRERGTDLTIFSPQASGMAHHEGGPVTSAVWSAACNDLISRVCRLYPENFVGVCQLPQSPGVSPETSVKELRRCVVRVMSKRADGSNRAGRGSADLFLCFDEVVGLAPGNLQTITRDRTVVVSSSSRTPTGQMITDVSRSLPDADSIQRVLRDAVGSGRLYRVDAQAQARSALGSATYANVFLLGVAFQAGAIPLSAGAIEEAISLNGVAVAANRRAFGLGRRWLLAQDEVLAQGELPPQATAAAAPVTGLPPSVQAAPGLRDAVLVRLADLTEYQDSKYAARYLDFVSAVADREAAVVGGGRHDLSLAVAANLHKLMAYKDEYEVARLHLNALAAGKFGSDVRVSFNLEPPVLKALGYDHKVEVGPWFRHVFRVLRAGRRLRGSRLDPFGLTEVRRLEQRLARDYVSGLRIALEVLTPDCYDAVCDLARLPDLVRGYEEVKLRNAARYDAQRQDLLHAILQGSAAAG